MPFNLEAGSATDTRFGFQDSTSESMPSVQSSPVLLKSGFRENLFQSSAIKSLGERDDYGGVVETANNNFEFQEDPSLGKDRNVQVIIRIRPLSSSEISTQGYSRCIRQDSCQTITWSGHPESRFTFDLVADENVSQEMLFKAAGVPMVENCMGGYNSCMFAYGQTGSGKTHTMLGDIEEGTRRQSANCGMTPRVFEYLFSKIQEEKEARREEKLRFACKCSFLEIYNEQILDLLEPSSVNLQIREDIKKGVYVDNLTELEVTSARDVIQQLVQGAANRKVAATNMNRASSRSHSVFTCIIESKWESQGVKHHRFARLNLVDLAGSERQKSSGAEGERLKEATNINKSLSTLGLVIMNLVNISNGKSQHVPYRDSKLTFLLQDSLGGNSKTSIIANISPSSCCALETLSTLKFAQRAKFIKNHAIVNEDASGDVLAMRMQIQQLKKEVSRLQSLIDGGARNNETDAWTISFPGSPGSFKWEGINGSFSPLTSDKRVSKKKDYEVALIGAFRREKDKDNALQALAAESQAAMKLAKQREDEIQGLKMRLRFREAGIKRLEAVAAGKISAETHLLKENEEYLKELEVLRAQVNRNQEVTRFAMENLRLKEEIRRLKSFCEDGERDMMNEQITVLQNKLLEALDWKLMHESNDLTSKFMHESDAFIVQKEYSERALDTQSDGNLLVSSQEPASPWSTSVNDENEFLRVQAIQNQSEIDARGKELDFGAVEKAKMERHADSLVTDLQAERSLKAAMMETKLNSEIELPSLSTDHMPTICLNDQIELKTMVDAIAAASEREAEAHETAITLSKENDELRMKLKVLIEDNNKLIELYERAVAENSNKNCDTAQNSEENNTEDCNNNFTVSSEEVEMKKVDKLVLQLKEMHEENDKLLGLYEKAMQERDEYKRMIFSGGENRVVYGGECYPEKLVEVDKGISSGESGFFGSHMQNGEDFASDKATASVEQSVLVEKGSLFEVNVLDDYTLCSGCSQTNDYMELDEPFGCVEVKNDLESEREAVEKVELEEPPVRHCSDTAMEKGAESLYVTNVKAFQDLSLLRIRLDNTQEKLLSSSQVIHLFGSLERAIVEVDKLSGEIEALENSIQTKQHECASSMLFFSEIQERRVLIDKKLAAVRHSLSCFASSLGYFEQRKTQAMARLKASSDFLNQKKDELARLHAHKDEIEHDQGKIQQSEIELKNKIAELESKIEEDTRRLENKRILFAIDNVEKPDTRSWQLTSKATELLKSEEQKMKLQSEMMQARERLGTVIREVEELNSKLGKVENKIRVVGMEMEKGLKCEEDMESRLQSIMQEMKTVLEMKESGINEYENMVIEYHQYMFETIMKEEEMKILDEELQIELRRVEKLETEKDAATRRKNQILNVITGESCFVSDKVEEELQNLNMSVMELKSLLVDDNPNVG